MKIKSFDRRNELMEAALDEFSTKNYEEASLNNIIRNAGISKGTFYYHFQDKQALYVSLIQSVAEAKIEFMERKIHDVSYAENLNIFDHFKLQARFGMEFAREYPKYYLLGLMLLREKGNEIYDFTMKLLGDTSVNFFDSMLDMAESKGELRAGVPMEFVKKILPYLFYRYDEIFDLKEDTMDTDDILKCMDDLIDFMQYGLSSDRLKK